MGARLSRCKTEQMTLLRSEEILERTALHVLLYDGGISQLAPA